MTIIDSHLHVFRSEKIGVIAQGGERRAGFSGTLDEVRSILDRGRIGTVLAIVTVASEIARRLQRAQWPDDLSRAARESRERALEEKLLASLVRENDWVCGASQGDDRVQPVVFAAPTLDGEAVAADIATRAERHALKAIKIHPALDFVLPSHPGYRPIFELAQREGLVVISHGGDSEGGPYEADVDYCAPEHFEPVLRDFPELRLVIAHLGYPYLDRLVELGARHPNLFSDLSFVLSREGVEPEMIRRAIREFGAERVCFGTDFPYFDPEKCLERLDALHLGSEQFERISSRNAAEIFGL